MSMHTLGDQGMYYTSRVTLRLLQSMAFMMYCIGWGLERSAPALLSGSARLKAYVLKHLESEDKREPEEVSQTRIPDTPKSEHQADQGDSEKIQVNSLSMSTGSQRNDSEVTASMPESAEETEIEKRVNLYHGTYKLPPTDVFGSMPCSAMGDPDRSETSS